MILVLTFPRGIWRKVWLTEKDQPGLLTTETKHIYIYLQIQGRPEFREPQ